MDDHKRDTSINTRISNPGNSAGDIPRVQHCAKEVGKVQREEACLHNSKGTFVILNNGNPTHGVHGDL